MLVCVLYLKKMNKQPFFKIERLDPHLSQFKISNTPQKYYKDVAAFEKRLQQYIHAAERGRTRTQHIHAEIALHAERRRRAYGSI